MYTCYSQWSYILPSSHISSAPRKVPGGSHSSCAHFRCRHTEHASLNKPSSPPFFSGYDLFPSVQSLRSLTASIFCLRVQLWLRSSAPSDREDWEGMSRHGVVIAPWLSVVPNLFHYSVFAVLYFCILFYTKCTCLANCCILYFSS